MTKNEFILQTMISMAGSKGQFNNTFHCVNSEAKRVAEEKAAAEAAAKAAAEAEAAAATEATDTPAEAESTPVAE